jgi:hypothetical protein
LTDLARTNMQLWEKMQSAARTAFTAGVPDASKPDPDKKGD